MVHKSRATVSLTISQMTNGYVVQAGCFHLAFTDREQLKQELNRWLEDPQQIEAEYRKSYATRLIDDGGTAERIGYAAGVATARGMGTEGADGADPGPLLGRASTRSNI